MATDRRNATAGYLGDLSVGQALEVVQDHDRTLRERQCGQSVGNRVHGQVPLGLRGRPGDGIGDVIEEIRQFSGPATGDLVQRTPGDDPVEPGRERGAGPEPARCSHAAIRASWAMSWASW